MKEYAVRKGLSRKELGEHAMFFKFNFRANVKVAVLGVAVASAVMMGSVAFADEGKGSGATKQEQPPSMPMECKEFPDVPPGSPYYSHVQCLVCADVISGYPDGTFGPNNPITRGQLSKLISNAIPLNNNPGSRLFEDVPVGHTFYDYIQRLAQLSIISGYDCGGPGEPCGPENYKYFRPAANATRGQIAKIISASQGFSEEPSKQTFEDMPEGVPFYAEAYRLALRGIISGYPCGGDGEPCGEGNLKYFRPNANATRGQVSKMVALTYMSCEMGQE